MRCTAGTCCKLFGEGVYDWCGGTPGGCAGTGSSPSGYALCSTGKYCPTVTDPNVPSSVTAVGNVPDCCVNATCTVGAITVNQWDCYCHGSGNGPDCHGECTGSAAPDYCGGCCGGNSGTTCCNPEVDGTGCTHLGNGTVCDCDMNEIKPYCYDHDGDGMGGTTTTTYCPSQTFNACGTPAGWCLCTSGDCASDATCNDADWQRYCTTNSWDCAGNCSTCTTAGGDDIGEPLCTADYCGDWGSGHSPGVNGYDQCGACCGSDYFYISGGTSTPCTPGANNFVLGK